MKLIGAPAKARRHLRQGETFAQSGEHHHHQHEADTGTEAVEQAVNKAWRSPAR